MPEIRINKGNDSVNPQDIEPDQGSFSMGWKQCLNFIGNEVPQQTVRTWFEPITPVSYIDNTLILRVPSRFFFEWIDSHYGQVLEKAAEKIFGLNTKLDFLVAPTHHNHLEVDLDKEIINDKKVSIDKSSIGYHLESHLDNHFTFDNYICSGENEVALGVAEHFAKNEKFTDLNPLFIYGEIGCGKTHLLHAIGQYLLSSNSDAKVCSITAEYFIHEYIFTLQNNKITEFKKFILNQDVFLLDDIQYFSNKKNSQDVLYFLLTQLHKHKKRIVITSNISLNLFKQINLKLISFFQKGLLIDVIEPNYDSRETIIRNSFEKHKIPMDDEVISLLNDELAGNTHLLKAALTRIIAHYSLLKKPIALSGCLRIVQQLKPLDTGEAFRKINNKLINIEHIIRKVSEYFEIPVELITGKSRRSNIVYARQIAIYFARKILPESLSSIGYHFGDRHHASVLHSYKKISFELKTNIILRKYIEEIKSSITE
jgi:chromosomal replication initiator protein